MYTVVVSSFCGLD